MDISSDMESQMEEDNQSITLIVEQLVKSTNPSEFFANFQLLCFEISIFEIETIEDKGVLFNEIYPALRLFKDNTSKYLQMNPQFPFGDILIKTFRLLQSIPLDEIIDDILGDSLFLCIKHAIENSNNLNEFIKHTELLFTLFPEGLDIQINLLYLEKYVPQLLEILNNPQTSQQLYDFQRILCMNKQLQEAFINKLMELLTSFNQNESVSRKDSLHFFFHCIRNLSIIDGSLFLSKMAFDLMKEKVLNTVNIADFLEFIQQEDNQKYYKMNWPEIKYPTFEEIDINLKDKYISELYVLFSKHYGDQLIMLYEKDIVNKLLTSTSNQLQYLSETFQFLQTVVFQEESQCEVMFNDVRNSLQSLLNDNEKKTILLSQAYWPQIQSISYYDLPEIQQWKSSNINKYIEIHKKQRLIYTQTGTVKLKYTTLRGVESHHIVTPIQATILLFILRSKETGVYLHDLAHEMGISGELALRQLEYWVNANIITVIEFNGALLLKCI